MSLSTMSHKFWYSVVFILFLISCLFIYTQMNSQNNQYLLEEPWQGTMFVCDQMHNMTGITLDFGEHSDLVHPVYFWYRSRGMNGENDYLYMTSEKEDVNGDAQGYRKIGLAGYLYNDPVKIKYYTQGRPIYRYWNGWYHVYILNATDEEHKAQSNRSIFEGIIGYI